MPSASLVFGFIVVTHSRDKRDSEQSDLRIVA